MISVNPTPVSALGNWNILISLYNNIGLAMKNHFGSYGDVRRYKTDVSHL